MQDLFTITTNIDGGVRVLRKKSSQTLNKILEKYLRKNPLFIKVVGSKEEFIGNWEFKEIDKYFSSILQCLSKFDFWEDCLGKPKLLFALNMLIYFNALTNRRIKNSRPPAPWTHTLHRINTSGIQVRPALKE